MVFYRSSLSISEKGVCTLYKAILQGFASAAAEVLNRLPQWAFVAFAVTGLIAFAAVMPYAIFQLALSTGNALTALYLVLGWAIFYAHVAYVIIHLTDQLDRKNGITEAN